MKFFIVSMSHPEGPEWNEHVLAHVRYLLRLIETGQLVASGPLRGQALRTGFLIMRGETREEIEDLVAGDPFAKENLIVSLTIEEWDPLFGGFSEQSSGRLIPELAELAGKV